MNDDIRPGRGHRMSEAEVELLAEEMMKMEGATISLEVGPSDEKLQREGRGATISSEAFDDLKDNLGRWIGSRILRRHDRTGKMTGTIRVLLTVTLDGEDPEAGEPVTFSFDGSNRR
jgi:hypothetical protein